MAAWTVRGTPLPFLPGRALSLVIGLSRDRPTGTVTTRAIATGGRTGSVSVSVSVCVRAELKSETVARRDYARPGPAGPLMVDCSSFLSAVRQGCGRESCAKVCDRLEHFASLTGEVKTHVST